MTELAIQADLGHKPELGDKDPEKEKREAIALCQRRIDAAINLYKDGRIDYEEYRPAHREERAGNRPLAGAHHRNDQGRDGTGACAWT